MSSTQASCHSARFALFAFAAAAAALPLHSHAVDIGFANKLDYTWNLWPRNTAFPAGFTQISDFAPDNSNVTSTPGLVSAVPEPGTAAMWLGGLAVAVSLARRRRASARP